MSRLGRRFIGLLALTAAAAVLLSGCTVRSYKVTKDRVDQDLTAGNKGYLCGSAPAQEAPVEKKKTRDTQVVEVEFRPWFKFEKAPKAQEKPVAAEKEEYLDTQEDYSDGNRGYIFESETPEMKEAPVMKDYRVKKGDTLQKISQKFYGTSRKWKKIYEANSDKLRGPDKILPGQVIQIPMEEKGTIPRNLK